MKLTPDPFNPWCEPDYNAVVIVTAKVRDPDTPLSELRVTASYFGAKLQGELEMKYDRSTQLFTVSLPRMYAKDVGVGRDHIPLVYVDVVDPRNESSHPFFGFASSSATCAVLGTLQNHV
ncbi:MAG: hypothetical protein HOV71_12590 [Hamadaea sp.]|nr:hypothetical protein [Hamadaea sp.]